MALIRIALIGLSSNATTGWASRAHLPYLLSPRGRSKYNIVALCNTSVASAQSAIKAYDLPLETKAYGSPVDLANDPDVDLVVCSTRVDTHFDAVRPSIEAGKDVFVEWPLTHSIESSRKLAELTKTKGVKSMVGLQGWMTPVALKIKELLAEGSLGKMLSSEIRAAGGTMDREAIAEGLAYFMDRKIGGNIYTIGFAHVFDMVQSVLGEAQDLYAHFQIQRPEAKLRDPQSFKIVGSVRSDMPDLIIATGLLPGSQNVQEGATLAMRLRRGQPFKGEPALTWHINCEKGEIRLTSPAESQVQAGSYSQPVTIDVHDFATDEVRNVEWKWLPWQEESELPNPSRSIAALYDAFADEEKSYPTFEDALRRHEQLDKLLSSWTTE